MELTILHFLQDLAGHTEWAEALVFLAAFLESVAVIGTFVPGSTAMFVAGALVGMGKLDVWLVLGLAIAGAICGDGLSYWIGRRYRDDIGQIWPFRRHPALLERGQAFFQRHGGKSIFLARFTGPIRAIVPVVAGMLDMPAIRFYAINVFSALAWAPAHVLPGVLFGASVKVAGAVTIRLAVMLCVIAILIWASIAVARWLLSHIAPWLNECADAMVQSALTHPHSRTGRLLSGCLGMRRQTGKTVILLGVILLAGGWLFFGVLEDVWMRDPLVRADISIANAFSALRTPWMDAAMSAIVTAGDAVVIVPVVCAAVLYLACRRQWQSILYWLGAIVFSQIALAGLHALAVNHGIDFSVASYSASTFPSSGVATSAVVYGFLAFLIASGNRHAVQVTTTGFVCVLVSLIAVAGLYLGAYWLSDMLGGLALGAAGMSLAAIALSRREQFRVSLRWLPLVALGAFIASSGVAMRRPTIAPISGPARPEPVQTISVRNWKDSVWRQLPRHRVDLAGETEEPFSVQWTGTPAAIESALIARGWQRAVPLTWQTAASALIAGTPVMQQPVFPTLNQGVVPSVALIYPARQGSERFVLRLWPTPYRVNNGGAPGTARPLWIGSVTKEREYRYLRSITLPRKITQDCSGACALPGLDNTADRIIY